MSFFIVRFDIGFPIYNPVFPGGSKWIFQSSENYIGEGLAKFVGIPPPNGYTQEQRDYVSSILPNRFPPAIHFGLGFPF